MKLKFILLARILIGFLFVFFSCDKESEFNQGEDLELKSFISANLLDTLISASTFNKVLAHDGQDVISNTSSLVDLGGNLEKTSLMFQFENSLDARFAIYIEFLNEINDITYKLEIPISSGTLERPTSIETKVILERSELKAFKETTKLYYQIKPYPNEETPIPEQQGFLKLQSFIIF